MRLQKLLVKEISLRSAEQWAAMDLILQQLKNSNVPSCGVFIATTGEPCQLPSVPGTNLLMSPIPMTTFSIHLLEYFVRMRDPEGDCSQAIVGEAGNSPRHCLHCQSNIRELYTS